MDNSKRKFYNDDTVILNRMDMPLSHENLSALSDIYEIKAYGIFSVDYVKNSINRIPNLLSVSKAINKIIHDEKIKQPVYLYANNARIDIQIDLLIPKELLNIETIEKKLCDYINKLCEKDNVIEEVLITDIHRRTENDIKYMSSPLFYAMHSRPMTKKYLKYCADGMKMYTFDENNNPVPLAYDEKLIGKCLRLISESQLNKKYQPIDLFSEN